MNVKEQKELAKYIIENLKESGVLHEAPNDIFVLSLTAFDLENFLYCAIAQWNADEIKKLYEDMKKANAEMREKYRQGVKP